MSPSDDSLITQNLHLHFKEHSFHYNPRLSSWLRTKSRFNCSMDIVSKFMNIPRSIYSEDFSMACSARLFFIPQLLADIFLNYSITQNHKKIHKALEYLNGSGSIAREPWISDITGQALLPTDCNGSRETWERGGAGQSMVTNRWIQVRGLCIFRPFSLAFVLLTRFHLLC